MNIPDTKEKSSCNRQTENGDQTMESERPLKKARYAWQVKGKYHLKNEVPDNDNTSTTITNDSDTVDSSSESDTRDTSNSIENSEQNLDELGDHLLKQDLKLQKRRHVNSVHKHSTSQAKRSSKHVKASIPVSMVLKNTYEDKHIKNWQQTQITAACVDNEANVLLESYGVVPMPPQSADNWHIALDFVELVENLSGNSRIENQGILMAISEHGLQNTSGSSSGAINWPDLNTLKTYEKGYNITPISSPVSSPCSNTSYEDFTNESLNNSEQSNIDSGSSSDLDTGISWSHSEETVGRNMNVRKRLTLFPKTLYQNSKETEDNPESNVDYLNMRSNDTNHIDSHYDILDTAVSFAIRDKGLTTFDTEFE